MAPDIGGLLTHKYDILTVTVGMQGLVHPTLCNFHTQLNYVQFPIKWELVKQSRVISSTIYRSMVHNIQHFAWEIGNWISRNAKIHFYHVQWSSGLFWNFNSYFSEVYSCLFSHVFEEIIDYPTIKFVRGVEFQSWIYVIPRHVSQEVKYIFHACHILVV